MGICGSKELPTISALNKAKIISNCCVKEKTIICQYCEGRGKVPTQSFSF